ncbi:MAG: glutamate formimidoyltransferase [Bacteroidota bacterium]
MTGTGPIVECIPNVSEGRDQKSIADMATAIQSVEGVKLLHTDVGYGANRTVFTFAGPPAATLEAAFRLFILAAERIDMRRHQGAHPRIGAVDVCPFVPIRNYSLADCAALARQLGQKVWDRLGIPVYLYEAAASAAYRRNLADLRKGEYEGLSAKMQQPKWRVDFGTDTWNAKTGTSVVGARPFLIAWNINLASKAIDKAKEIAGLLREKGQLIKQPDGTLIRRPGLFPGLKAIGWFIEEYGRCQVSMNVVRPNQVSLLQVYSTCRRLGYERGVHVTGSELIGLIPEQYLIQAGNGLPRELALDQAVKQLGLDDLKPFDWRKKVLEELL